MCEKNVKFVKEVEKRPVLYNYTLPGYSRRDVTDKAWMEVAQEMNMTVDECRERWRNCRTVFIRNLKSQTNCKGSTKRRAYYLSEEMQFTIPFLKSLNKDVENMPNPLQDVEETFYNSDSNEESLLVEMKPSLVPPEPTIFLPLPTFAETLTPAISQQQDSTSEYPWPASNSARKRCARNSDVDNSSVQCSNDKMANHVETRDMKSTSRREACKMFLMSLLPDLESMNDNQLRQFKRRCLQTIDELL